MLAFLGTSVVGCPACHLGPRDCTTQPPSQTRGISFKAPVAPGLATLVVAYSLRSWRAKSSSTKLGLHKRRGWNSHRSLAVAAHAGTSFKEFSTADGRRVHVFGDDEGIAATLVAQVAAAVREDIAEKGAFSICMPGGFGPADGGKHSWAVQALAGLANEALDFSKFHVYLCGERLDGQEGYDHVRKAWADACKVPLEQIYGAEEGMPAEGAAATYTAAICMQDENVISDSPEGLPAVDMMVLDLADDGTVGRIRPNSSEANALGSEQVVHAIEDGAAEAVAVSLDFMSASRRAIIVANGQAPDTVIDAALASSNPNAASPAGAVRASSTTWLCHASSMAGGTEDSQKTGSAVQMLD